MNDEEQRKLYNNLTEDCEALLKKYSDIEPHLFAYSMLILHTKMMFEEIDSHKVANQLVDEAVCNGVKWFVQESMDYYVEL